MALPRESTEHRATKEGLFDQRDGEPGQQRGRNRRQHSGQTAGVFRSHDAHLKCHEHCAHSNHECQARRKSRRDAAQQHARCRAVTQRLAIGQILTPKEQPGADEERGHCNAVEHPVQGKYLQRRQSLLNQGAKGGRDQQRYADQKYKKRQCPQYRLISLHSSVSLPIGRVSERMNAGWVMAAKFETDEVYRDARSAVGDFKFDQSVATVFDDMVTRSVPFYGEIQRMIVEMARDFATPGEYCLRSRLLDRDHVHQSASAASIPSVALRWYRQLAAEMLDRRAAAS